jgi:hypothetical protein
MFSQSSGVAMAALGAEHKSDASAAAAADHLCCPLCYEQFRAPILQCSTGHSFCQRCLEQWQRTCAAQRTPTSCPECFTLLPGLWMLCGSLSVCWFVF